MLTSQGSIYVPVIEGDIEGELQNALVYALNRQGVFAYGHGSAGGDYTLNVSLRPLQDEVIGYTLSRGAKNTLFAVPQEGRLALQARVTLIDGKRGCALYGPENIDVSLNYDFAPDTAKLLEHRFTLGQLEMRPLAKDAALRPGYTLLSEKIADFVATYARMH